MSTNHRMNLANEFADRVIGANGNACERYGMMWGCDGNCPIFANGECKMDDVDSFRKAILTSDDFDGYTREELNKMYPKLNL